MWCGVYIPYHDEILNISEKNGKKQNETKWNGAARTRCSLIGQTAGLTISLKLSLKI
jgi:hypothetical protein